MCKCKICGGDAHFFDKAKILGKYDVSYYQCASCCFIQTEEPYWLSESYTSAITESDIGLIYRNINFSNTINNILKVCFKQKTNFLDYGGGYGMFVRIMRDKGYDFEWYDAYCENLFARHHEKSHSHYDIVTTFEMFEHLENPLATIEKLLSLCDTLIFSTELLRNPAPKVHDWWYYATDSGQHIAFYSKKTLKYIANKFGKKYYTICGMHIFTCDDLSSWKYRFLLRHKRIMRFYCKNRPSLLSSDYEKLTGVRLE